MTNCDAYLSASRKHTEQLSGSGRAGLSLPPSYETHEQLHAYLTSVIVQRHLSNTTTGWKLASTIPRLPLAFDKSVQLTSVGLFGQLPPRDPRGRREGGEAALGGKGQKLVVSEVVFTTAYHQLGASRVP